jgi:hypothetical protein
VRQRSWSLVRDVYFYSSGQSVPSGALPTFLYICSIAAVWVLWFRERQARRLHEAPELSGEAFDFSGYGIHGILQSLGQWQADTEMSFQLYLCNTRPVPTIVRSIELDGKALTPPLKCHWPSLRSRLNNSSEILLGTHFHYGIGKVLTVQVDIAADGFKSVGDVPPVQMDKLVIRVQDSFGHWHGRCLTTPDGLQYDYVLDA